MLHHMIHGSKDYCTKRNGLNKRVPYWSIWKFGIQTKICITFNTKVVASSISTLNYLLTQIYFKTWQLKNLRSYLQALESLLAICDANCRRRSSLYLAIRRSEDDIPPTDASIELLLVTVKLKYVLELRKDCFRNWNWLTWHICKQTLAPLGGASDSTTYCQSLQNFAQNVQLRYFYLRDF